MFESEKEKFRRLLEENLPFVQRKILNLENYVPRADFEKILAENQTLQANLEKLSDEKNFLSNERKNLRDQLSQLQKNFSTLETENNHLQSNLEKVSAEKVFLTDERNNLRAQVEYFQKKVEEFKKISAECDYYRKSFAEIDSVYKKYLSLTEEIRYRLAGIFGDGDTVQGFLFGAANEKHLNDFWEYLRYSINDGRLSPDEIEKLSAIFDFCFDALNKSSREPIFVRLETEIDSRFDNSRMTRTSDSRQLGKVKKILLEGYTNRVGKIIQPSLVFVGE
ncbi:MAG: hypothetical protein IJT73_11445 [Selenomonadaceae bacterium]|nr:hypothetical protein [Selenomonadaceae bacterium]